MAAGYFLPVFPSGPISKQRYAYNSRNGLIVQWIGLSRRQGRCAPARAGQADPGSIPGEATAPPY